ncbi:hypothetical protein EW146_g7579 [Bondarzewia mesenterica]|uniref:Uncharacterized protein n=1 Tax=Bondarzewia mesenterica TaxID=1095465 RepID=A0A4S4LKC7_9AGAM|nr:hypothetical protein EW146_g7579 [Bondarzewia mesenterica]
MSPLPLTTDLPKIEMDTSPLGVSQSSAVEIIEVKKSVVRQMGGGGSGKESMVMAVETEARVVDAKVDKGKRKVVGGGEVATAVVGTKQW